MKLSAKCPAFGSNCTYNIDQFIHFEFLVENRFGLNKWLVFAKWRAAVFQVQVYTLEFELFLPKLRVGGILRTIWLLFFDVFLYEFH